MTKHGGKRPRAGRRPLDASQKKQPKTVWLSPEEIAVCLRYGETAQDGIRHIIAQVKDEQERIPPRQTQ
jgi:hypothetical protein